MKGYKMKKILTLLIVSLLLAAPAVAEMKIGVVDIRKAIEESEIGKATQLVLEKDKKDFEQEMMQLEDKLKALEQDLRKQADVLMPGALADKERELQKKFVEAQQIGQERGSKLQRKIQSQLGSLQDSFLKIAEELSKKEGYDFVFERSSLIHALEAADFTDKVIAEANKSLKK
jgi:outer membrane protein